MRQSKTTPSRSTSTRQRWNHSTHVDSETQPWPLFTKAIAHCCGRGGFTTLPELAKACYTTPALLREFAAGRCPSPAQLPQSLSSALDHGMGFVPRARRAEFELVAAAVASEYFDRCKTDVEFKKRCMDDLSYGHGTARQSEPCSCEPQYAEAE